MPSSNELVSVLIPSYNHESYIEECLISIVKQTHKEIEILLLDDGSIDKTFELSKFFLKCNRGRFRRIFAHKVEHRGLINNLNSLIDMAEGRYIYIIASDDCAKPDAISTLLSALERIPNAVLSVGDNKFIDSKSRIINVDKNLNESCIGFATFGQLLNCEKLVRSNKFGNYIDLLSNNHVPNGYLILKSALNSVNRYSENLYPEDWSLHLKLSKVGNYVYVTEPLFYYRCHEKNTVKSKWYKTNELYNRRKLLLQEKEWCIAHGYKYQWNKEWKKYFSLKKVITYRAKCLIIKTREFYDWICKKIIF